MIRRVWEDVESDGARDALIGAMSAALDVPPVIARLLCQRGLTDPEAARQFLNPDLSQLHDPFLLADMRPAVDRIRGAIARRERIVIHGDYDVDGITATVILRRAIERLGGDVHHFVPDRLKDGYGLQPSTVERLHAAGAQVVISVDCGIRATEAATSSAVTGTSSTADTMSPGRIPARSAGAPSIGETTVTFPPSRFTSSPTPV